MHDLGLETICKALSGDDKERRLITNVLSKITDDVNVTAYRREIFADIIRLPELRKNMMQLFDRIQFMKDFSTMLPADEDKTMDLGRLGEECVRFKEIVIDNPRYYAYNFFIIFLAK